MQKNNVKTETVAEFIARGGTINKVAAKGPKKTYRRVMKDAELDQEIDFDSLPAALKIKYGIGENVPVPFKKKVKKTKDAHTHYLVICSSCKIRLVVPKEKSKSCDLCKSTDVSSEPWK